MRALFTTLALFAFITCFAQYQPDTIQVTRNGNVIKYHDRPITTIRQLENIVSFNPETAWSIKEARINETFGSIFGGIGGCMIGWPIGTAIGGGEPQWAMAIAGAGFIGLAIPFASAAKKHKLNAIRIYNEGITINKEKDITIKPISGKYGAGICIKF